MRFSYAFRAVRATLALAGLLALVACAVPLGPAYTVEKQQIDVRLLASSTPRLAVRFSYRLKNTGNQQLSSLEAGLPDAKTSGRQNLQVWLDGREVPAQSASESQGSALRITIDPPWLQKQEREVVIAYELTAGTATAADWAIERDAFYLGRQGWSPVLRAPRGAFAEGGERLDTTEVTVYVPQEFRAHASGRATGARKQNGEIKYHFRVRKQDFNPFVVAGRYHEQPVRAPNGTVIFWMLQPVPAEQAQQAGERLAATVKTYDTVFGPRAKKPRPVWVVQWPAAEATALPEVALQGGAWNFDEAFLSDVEAKLASTWFLHLVSPRPDSLFLANVLTHYAAFVAAEARGTAEPRQTRIASLLSQYDDARAHSKEKPLSSMARADSAEQRQLGSIEARLFLFALEDRCGKQAVQHALARVIRARRGNRWAVEDFRSALEAETGRDLGELFRVWLHRAGVPADFRARYQEKIQPK